MKHPKTFLLSQDIESPCQDFCPIALSCHGYIGLIKEGEFEEAYRLIRQRLPLPLSVGRVCDRPCEKVCRRAQIDKPVAIRYLKRFLSDYAYTHDIEYVPKVRERREEQVAIVGAGPAGLACAYDLAREGFQVTIFEALPVAGGMLAIGTPRYRLPGDLLRADIENIEKLGVEIRFNTPITDIASLLEEGFRALFLAIGCQEGKKLPIEGAELGGILTGLGFLREVNLGRRVELGERVLILGGGGVGLDCARTALRMGAQVSVACLEPRENMPAEPEEVVAAEEEGVSIYPSRSFLRILGAGGRAKGVEAILIEGFEFDEEGRPRMEVLRGSEHILEADTVIFAVGQGPGLPNLRRREKGLLVVNPDTLETDIRGVFAGGDIVSNAGSVIQAIADGQRAALSIIAYLNGETPSRQQRRRDDELIPIPSLAPTEEEVERRLSVPARFIDLAERRSSFKEAVLTYSQEEALEEASRCLRCDLLQPAKRIRPEGEGVAKDLSCLVEDVRREGVISSRNFLRRALLHGLGIKRKVNISENVIILGCLYVFGMPRQVLSSLRLLDHLGVEYTFLRDKEYCCGLPLVEWIGGEKATEAAREFCKMIIADAKKIGAKRVVYLCQWCAYLGKSLVREETTPQLYILDFLAEHLPKKPIPVAPARVGYYEGCHIRRLSFAPRVELGWEHYRELLHRLEGLEIVELPHWRCCVIDAERIVEEALRKKVDYIVCSCAACWTWVERVSVRKNLPTKMLQDLIAEALGLRLL